MSSKHQKIIAAAGQLFARYGVGKTTMNDIAREAGVARQTLYNAYPNKDEILRAVVRLNVEETHGAVTAAWKDAKDFGEKIDIFAEAVPLNWYDMVQSSPEMADLVDGLHLVAKAELDQAARLWISAFETELRGEGVPGADCAGLADYIYATSTNAKHNAENRSIVETRLRLFKVSLLALIESY